MENFNHDCDYDYRHYDRIWQRVAPHLDPYPEVRQGEVSGGTVGGMAGCMVGGMSGGMPGGMPGGMMGGMMPRGEENLPGAQMDPCCMGTVARDSLAVLDDYIEEELAGYRYYCAFARQAPSAAVARMLRELAQEELAHARRLMAVHYLITGECYRPSLVCERPSIPPWCQALRERYHAEACGGFNYIRTADATTDPCLIKLLTELSESEYRHARKLLELLEQSMGQAVGKMSACASGCRGV